MDFKQIDAFVNVAKYRSFSRAAEAIYLSQPTVSAHIASLEEELGILLFDRHGKDIRLTPAGTLFLEYAINMIDTRNNAVIDLSELDQKIVGSLTIATSTSPLRSLLPKLLTNYHKLYPDITYDIKETSSRRVIDMLLAWEIDLGFVGEVHPDDKLCYTKIKSDKLIVISNDNTLPQTLTLADIKKLPFIIREPGSATRHMVDSFLKANGANIENLKITSIVSSLEAVLQLVKVGFGVSIVAETACNNYLEAGLIKKHDISGLDEHQSLTQDFYVVSYTKRTMTPLAKSFYSHALEYFKLR